MRAFKGRFGATTVMLSSFAAALVFAIGHHAFYQSLDNTPVSSAAFTQQINTAVGTAFAFTVRALIVIALGSAYSQVLWRVLLRRRLSVTTVDSLSQLLTSVWELLSLHLTWRHPALIILACLAWITPFSTIVPPATLSVHSTLSINHTVKPVTMIDWRRILPSTVGVAGHYYPARGPLWDQVYTQTSRTTYNLAMAVALQGYIPAMPWLISNTSHKLDFTAPALRCQNLPPTMFENRSFSCGTANPSIEPYAKDLRFGFNVVRYLSWVPDAQGPLDGILRQISTSNGAVDCSLIESYTGMGASYFPFTAPKLMVAVLLPNSTKLKPTGGLVEIHGEPAQTWRLIECELQEAAYTVEFNSTNGEQILTVLKKQLQPLERTCERLAEFLDLTPKDPLAECRAPTSKTPITDRMARTMMNYVTMINLIGQVAAGRITIADTYQGSFNKMPSILTSQLAYTSEFIEMYSSSWVGNRKGAPYPNISSLSVVNSTGTLAAGLEELFENIILSLFSYSPMTNSTQRVANVSSWASQNVYAYSWKHLVASYASGLLISAIVVAYGCFTVSQNGGSYQTRFSTFLRTVRWSEIDSVVADRNHDGAEPLPRAVAKKKLRLGGLRMPSDAALETDKSERGISPTRDSTSS